MLRTRQHRVALAFVLAFSALLECYRLQINGWANQYYSAAVKSMLGSLHNFFFVSSDPGGLITVDKPPLGLWLQTASAAIFGFHPLSVLLPEALLGVATVAVLYRIVAPRFGPWAGVTAAAALAVFPSFVASARDNNLDALLIALMTLACLTGLRAIESGRWRWLLVTAMLVGLAFNTKTLAAFLIVPGLAAGWLVGAPGSFRRRLGMLAGGAVALAAVSLVWLVIVDVTPASQRPYVGGTTDNSELSLSFGHNGLGRVLGERGAPGHVVHLHVHVSAGVPARPRPPAAHTATAAPAPHPAKLTAARVAHRQAGATSSSGPPGPLRLFDIADGDQCAWLLPFALFGLLAIVLAVRRAGRRDQRVALLLVAGGWFLVEAVVLSVSTGIVHPYYVSALGPGVGAMVGAGAAAFVELVRRDRRYLALPVGALIATLVLALLIAHREYRYLEWLWPGLVLVVALAVIAMLWQPRLVTAALAVGVGASLVFPAIYSATTWEVPTDGTFPVAGPYIQDNQDSLGIPVDTVQSFRTLVAYVRAHDPGSRWDLLTEGSTTAAALTLVGGRAAAMGGYGTTDPALSPSGLAKLIATGQTRYVALGGGYSSRGGNKASAAVALVCPLVPFSDWRAPFNYGTAAHPDYRYPHGGWNLDLYDCGGRTHALAAVT